MLASGGRVAFGIDQVDADAARSELNEWVNAPKPEYLHDSFDEPFMNITLEVKALVRKYFEVRLQCRSEPEINIPRQQIFIAAAFRPPSSLLVRQALSLVLILDALRSRSRPDAYESCSDG